MSNCLVSDQDRPSVGHDLGPNCLQRLSADDMSLLARIELKVNMHICQIFTNNSPVIWTGIGLGVFSIQRDKILIKLKTNQSLIILPDILHVTLQKSQSTDPMHSSFSGTLSLIFSLSLPLHQYFVYARSKGSGKAVLMLRHD